MTRFEERGPRSPIVQPTRVDKVHPRAQALRRFIALVSLLMAIIMLLPVFVMGISAFKTRAANVASVSPATTSTSADPITGPSSTPAVT